MCQSETFHPDWPAISYGTQDQAPAYQGAPSSPVDRYQLACVPDGDKRPPNLAPAFAVFHGRWRSWWKLSQDALSAGSDQGAQNVE